MNNDSKLSFKQKLICCTIEPVIEKVLRSSYIYYCDNVHIPFTDTGFEYYMNDIKYLLQKGDVLNNG